MYRRFESYHPSQRFPQNKTTQGTLRIVPHFPWLVRFTDFPRLCFAQKHAFDLPKVSGRDFHGSRCGYGLSESCEERALLCPVRWQGVRLAPFGGEACRLLAVEDIPDDVWGEERQINHLPEAALGCAVCCRDLCKGLTGLDAFEPGMRFGNVPDQRFIARGWLISHDDLCLDTALAELEWVAGDKGLGIDDVGLNIETTCKRYCIKRDCQFPRRDIDPLDQREKFLGLAVILHFAQRRYGVTEYCGVSFCECA